jgi:mRNA interferase MazF
MNSTIDRGEIWNANLDPTVGREQAGKRPALVVSVDVFNHGPSDLVIVVPLTSKDKRNPLNVAIDAPEGGLKVRSYAKCEDVRSMSRTRLSKRLGVVSSTTMALVEDRLRILLRL